MIFQYCSKGIYSHFHKAQVHQVTKYTIDPGAKMNLDVLNGLLNAVKNARKEAECYGSILEQMESDIGSCIPKIEGSNFTMNQDDKLWEKIKGGEEFVNKCVSELPRKKGNKCSTCASKICFCICCKRCRRKKQLKSLNSSLQKFCEEVDRSQKKEPDTQEKAEYTQGSQGEVSLGKQILTSFLLIFSVQSLPSKLITLKSGVVYNFGSFNI